MNECCAVVDLRQYTLHPGQRDTLIELFDTYFVDGQEATGMHIAGQFRDLDDPDRFVWIRGFRDLPARADALNAFYYGPVWRAHAAAANATMIDSDNALLLRPVRLGPSYPRLDAPRSGVPASVIAGAVYHRGAADDGFAEYFEDHVVPVLTATGAEPVAVFETLVAENNFPQLPLRDEVVLAWFARFPGVSAYDEHRRQLAASRVWREQVLPELVCRSKRPMQELRLSPTAGSQFR
ncbi:NIPSNAP family protein [Kribbella sp.]|uniref:NIPSNAP family protein n=1 Tax=Kribbella sp. TaxID=1871183 RepID=UPI002D2FFE9E|nr:NIPSNAP family protein [Kribbella sp.]HZX04512.1 NIPSNAP family protein [Kribbella sp.]